MARRLCRYVAGGQHTLSILGQAKQMSSNQPGMQRRSVADHPSTIDREWDGVRTYEYEDLVEFPHKVDILMIGGGLSGLALAHSLSQMYSGKILLLERSRLGEGATLFSTGLLATNHMWQSVTLPIVLSSSTQIYSSLYRNHRALEMQKWTRLLLAFTDASVLRLRRVMSFLKTCGVVGQLLGPEEVKQICKHPLEGDVRAALLINDVKVNQYAAVHAFAVEACHAGLNIVENCSVNALETEKNRVIGAHTDLGFVACNVLVDTSGVNAGKLLPKLSAQRFKALPLQPLTYSYLTLGGDASNAQPNAAFYDIDLNIGIADRGREIVCGGFDPKAFKESGSRRSRQLPYQELPEITEDWDSFGVIMEKLAYRFPSLVDLPVTKLIGICEAFTPDGLPLIGFLPDFHNYFCFVGMSGFASALSPGLSRIASQWLLGLPLSADVSHFDVTRFVPLHCNQHYLCQRAPEVAGSVFSSLDPLFQWSSARNLRTSALHYQLKEAGGVFGESVGFEEPLYFATEDDFPSVEVGGRYPVGKPKWYPFVESEYRACRERVAVMDFSAYSKFEITGHSGSVIAFLQKLSSANIDQPIGTTVFTGMHNESGGYVTDCTLSRFGQYEFFLVAPSLQQTRLMMWLKQHMDPYRVTVHDVTSKYTTINVVGPASRLLLQELTDENLCSQNFPIFTCKEINVSCASSLKAVSVTHSGELGWTLYIPNEFALYVFQEIMRLGKSYGAQLAGAYALNSLRIEKFYIRWGVDINSHTTPNECGRLFRVDLTKDFIGKEAMLAERENGVRRQFVQLLLQHHDLYTDCWPQGNEPIYRNGVYCGLTTSAAYGYTLGCQVCIGHVSVDGCMSLPDAISYIQDEKFKYEVEIAGKRFRVKVNVRSPQLPMVSSEHPRHYRPTQ